MLCPKCNQGLTNVTDSRREGNKVNRRRKCACGFAFWTVETFHHEAQPYVGAPKPVESEPQAKRKLGPEDRRRNIERMKNCLTEKGRQALCELARNTGLSTSTIKRIIADEPGYFKRQRGNRRLISLREPQTLKALLADENVAPPTPCIICGRPSQPDIYKPGEYTSTCSTTCTETARRRGLIK